MSPGLVVLVLTLMLGLQPITTDLYLPALPALTQGFGAPMSQAQLTLTALLPLVWPAGSSAPPAGAAGQANPRQLAVSPLAFPGMVASQPP